MCTFCYLSSISAMPLPQTNCNKFCFFVLFWQCHCHKFIPTSFFFFPQFRQWHCHKSTRINFVPSYFDNAIATIPFHFFLSQKNMTNQTVSVKKNTERIRICILFFISLIYLGNAIATNNNFFFHPIQIHFHIFFSSISSMALPQTMYFFLFLFTALQNKNIVLVFRIYVLFFFVFLYITLE